MEPQSCHDLSFKELPTREQKLRRNKDRRDSPTVPPVRLRLKNCTSPLQENDVEKHLSDRSLSSSPDGISLHLSQNYAFSSYSKYAVRTEPLASTPVVTEASSSFIDVSDHCNDSMSSGSITDSEQPLDMTTKRVIDSAVAPNVQSVHLQQQRPSVITCASALLQTHCSAADVKHHMCKVTSTDWNTRFESQQNTDSDSSCDSVKKDSETRPGHRREIVSGSCDPVIDEHFRRSLGKDYQQIFSKSSSNSVSITVDDHFAKALGDTWRQLQKSQPEDSDSPQPAPMQSLHSKPFLQPSPEIVST